MSGFSFGSAPVAAPAAAPAAAPLTFGAPAPAPAAPLAPPAAPANSFAPAAAPSAKEIANAYKSKSLEEIINSYSTSLTTDASSFLSQAKRVSEWDGILRSSSTQISQLTSQISRLMLQQDEVDKVLNGVGSYQSELDTQLSQLEGMIDTSFESLSSREPIDADVQRERSYQQIIDVDHRLRSILGSLDTTISDLNAASESEVKEGSVGQIVKILNAHHETLGWLEGKARGVERELSDVNRK